MADFNPMHELGWTPEFIREVQLAALETTVERLAIPFNEAMDEVRAEVKRLTGMTLEEFVTFAQAWREANEPNPARAGSGGE